jgi:hypothetical protein
MTSEGALRALKWIILVALVVGTLGSLGLLIFRDYLSRFPSFWG